MINGSFLSVKRIIRRYNMWNQMKTVILLSVLSGLLLLFGGMFAGRTGIIFAFAIALMMNFFSYFYSDKIVLALYRAREADPSEHRDLYNIVRDLAQRANLPMPKIYIVPLEIPNAFATGRNPQKSVVAVTQGLLNMMTYEELEGVLGHELSHIKHRDILISTVAATIASALMMLANMAKWAAIFGGFARSDDDDNNIFVLLISAILVPIIAVLLQAAISRSREYLADAGSARITGNPEGLARALEKIAGFSNRYRVVPPTPAHGVTAHMFIYNPFSGMSLLNLFSTHPPVEERIRRLRSGSY